MKTIRKILRIAADGCLVQYNERLRVWELVYRSWSWADIDKKYFKQSKLNYERNEKEKRIS